MASSVANEWMLLFPLIAVALGCVVEDPHGGCVTCPVGSYPDTNLQDCELCPLGFYQDQYNYNGTSCIECHLHEYLKNRHTTITVGSATSKACLFMIPDYSVIVTFIILVIFAGALVSYFWWKAEQFPAFPLRVLNVVLVPILYFVCDVTYLHWIWEMEADGEPVYNHDVFNIGAALTALTALYWGFFLVFFCIASCGQSKIASSDTKVKCTLPVCACGMLPWLCIIRDFVVLVGNLQILVKYASVPIHLLNVAEQDTGIVIDAPHITDYRVPNSGLIVAVSIFLIVAELIWFHYDWNLGLSIDRVLHTTKADSQKNVQGIKQIRSDEG